MMKKSILLWVIMGLVITGVTLTGCEEIDTSIVYSVSDISAKSVTSCDGDIKIDLGSGYRTENSVVFYFSMTNNGSSISAFELYNTAASYAYDNKGNSYTYRKSGSHKMRLTFDGLTAEGSTISRYFGFGKRLGVKIEFTDVPEDVEYFNDIVLKVASSQKLDRDKIILTNVK